MIPKCPVCRSKNLKIVQDAILCLTCENIVNNDTKDSTIEMLTKEVSKEKQREDYGQALQKLQEDKLKKPYLRFQLRVL